VLALRSAGRAQGSVQVSAVAHTAERGQEQHLVLHGEAGTLEADLELAGPRWGVRGAGADDEVFAPLALPDDLAGPVDPARPLFEQLRAYFTTQSVGDRAFVDAILDDRPATPSFAPFAARARGEPGWRYRELATGHDAMLTAPEALAGLLLELTAPRPAPYSGLPAHSVGARPGSSENLPGAPQPPPARLPIRAAGGSPSGRRRRGVART
jgi:hypothetical protein